MILYLIKIRCLVDGFFLAIHKHLTASYGVMSGYFFLTFDCSMTCKMIKYINQLGDSSWSVRTLQISDAWKKSRLRNLCFDTWKHSLNCVALEITWFMFWHINCGVRDYIIYVLTHESIHMTHKMCGARDYVIYVLTHEFIHDT